MLAERPLVQVALRCLGLSVLVLLAGTPLYVWVEPSWRPLVARLGGGLVLGVALLQLRRVVADRVEAGGGSALDAARASRGPEPALPHHFVDLVSDVRTARRSRRYFETVLWPRLETLAGRPLARPALRPGRGPGLAAVRGAIAEIERRP